MRPEKLWLLSIALQKRGHRRLAKLVKNVNSAIYHNSLPPGASVSPDIELGHHGFGTVIHTNVVIGRSVKIWQNVTIAMRAGSKAPYRIVIEDDVTHRRQLGRSSRRTGAICASAAARASARAPSSAAT